MNIKYLILKYRRSLIVAMHLLLIIFAFYISFCLRFEFSLNSYQLKVFFKFLPLLIIIKMVVFAYTGIFYGLWRYVNVTDIWHIFKANIIATIIFIMVSVFVFGLQEFPRSVFILDWLISIVLITGIRFLTRIIRQRFKPLLIKNKKKVLIVGAGQAGILLLNECKSNPNINMEVVGFIDDDPVKFKQTIQNVKVLGNRKNIPELVDQYSIEEIILALPSQKGETIRNILSYCEIPNINIKILPSLDKLINGNLQVKPKNIEPEDLLGREIVEIDENDINSYIKNKKVLVTGAGGSIGSELCRQIAKFLPSQMVILDHNENDVYFLVVELKNKYPNLSIHTIIGDVKDIGLLKNIFTKFSPEVVFHAAAHKHVPLMEENPIAAVKNNIIASRNLIYASEHYGVERFVLISTDKAVNPVNVMGMTKRIVEMIMQSKSFKSKTKFMAVRFGNVIGSAGSVVPLFKKQIEQGGPVTVTDSEAKRYFMSIREAVLLVLQAGALGKGGEIFILDMGEQVKVIDIAKNLIALSGLQLGKDINIQVVGLRPGEKLYEEILLNTEKDSVTKNKKIYVTEPYRLDLNKLRSEIRELEYYVNLMDEKSVKDKIKEIIKLSL